MLEDNLKALIKPQYVEHIPKAIKGNKTVKDMLTGKDQNSNLDLVINLLDLTKVLDREPNQLSGGELQRFAIAMTCVQKAEV